MKLSIKKLDGSATDKQINLSKDVFGIEPAEHAVYLAVKAELANQRQGSASTKNRGEVAGSGVKLFRQKGTGRARVGDIRSPIRTGGGVAFGPKPRSYRQKVNKKVRSLARRSLLSVMLKNDRIIVVEALNLEDHKTQRMSAAIKALGIENRRVTIAAAAPSENLWLASRNLQRVSVKRAKDISAYDIWSTDYLVIDQVGVKDLQTALSN